MGDPRQALGLLRDATASGELAALCRRYDVTLLVAFGSTVHGKPNPRDLDLAALAGDLDIIGLINDLMSLTGIDEIDLMDLRRARPVAREQALLGCEVLFEEHDGTVEREQLVATMERMETAWLRRLDLELMAQ